MNTGLAAQIKAGMRVRVTQRLSFGGKGMETVVEGEVLRFGQQKTGSWFAHSRDDKLWIDRIEMKKDDGELVVCNLDQHSVVEVLG